MKQVSVSIPWNLVPMTNGAREVQVEGETVAECLEKLANQFLKLKQNLFNSDGTLHGDVLISLNGKLIQSGVPSIPVEDGDTLAIAVIIGGG